MNKDRIPLGKVIATLKPIVANIAENYSFPSFIVREISSENFDVLVITWKDKLGYLKVDRLFALRLYYDSLTRVIVIADLLLAP